jgi:hypothetical protein
MSASAARRAASVVATAIAVLDVQTRLWKEHKRKAAWLGGGTDAPVGVGPEVGLIGRCAALALDAALTRT